MRDIETYDFLTTDDNMLQKGDGDEPQGKRARVDVDVEGAEEESLGESDHDFWLPLSIIKRVAKPSCRWRFPRSPDRGTSSCGERLRPRPSRLRLQRRRPTRPWQLLRRPRPSGEPRLCARRRPSAVQTS